MEIKMVQCPQGHYYNAAIHSSCPECGAAPSVVGATIAFGSAGGAGNFSPTEAPGAMPQGAGSFSPTEAPGVGGTGAKSAYGGNTVPITPGDRGIEVEEYDPTVIGGDIADQSLPDPVVGWLVCIDGPERGTDYRIHAGYNYIGREVGDIHIHGDNQISRQNHAMIAYDSGDHAYYFGPSGGRNLIKVNGKTILNAVEVKNYDVFTIGTSKLMFVALCGPHFDWNEGRSNE